MTKEELQKAYEKAYKRRHNLRNDISKVIEDAREKRIAPLREQIEKEEAKIKQEIKDIYDKQLDNLNIEVGDLQAQLDAIKVEEAKNSNDGYSIGTLLVEWRAPSWRYKAPKQETGRRCIVEVYDGTQPMPGNRGAWSIPNLGDKYGRIIKNDGKTGKQVFLDFCGWYPEGVDPNKKQ